MSKDDRIEKLSQRFQNHAVGRKPSASKSRERKSFYLDGELVATLDRQYKAVEHDLYPASLSKSEFLEALFEYSLDHLDEVTKMLSDNS